MKAIAALIVAFALGACGGSSSNLPAGEQARSGAPTLAAASPGASISPTSSPEPGKPTAKTAPVTPHATASGSRVAAALANECARAGTGTQTLTVTGLPTSDATGFSTQYSDGSNELTNRSYTSGYGSGKAGDDGRFARSWTVPASAPAGRAEVLVIWSSGHEPLRVSFTIPAPGGGC